MRPHFSSSFFFFNDTATTEIYTLPYTTLFRSPFFCAWVASPATAPLAAFAALDGEAEGDWDDCRAVRGSQEDRKSTRLNSSHGYISYAVFCLKKKKNICLSQVTSTYRSGLLLW